MTSDPGPSRTENTFFRRSFNANAYRSYFIGLRHALLIRHSLQFALNRSLFKVFSADGGYFELMPMDLLVSVVFV